MAWWLFAPMGLIGLAIGLVLLEPVPIGFGLVMVVPLVNDVLWCYAETNDDGLEWRTFVVRRQAPWSDIGELAVVPFSLLTIPLIDSDCIFLKRPGRVRGQRVRSSEAASRRGRAAFCARSTSAQKPTA